MSETIIISSLTLLVGLLLYLRNKKKKYLNKENLTNKEKTEMQKLKRGKQEKVDYISLFMLNSDIKARTGKLVYIRPKHHEKVSKIIHVIGNNKLTIFSYIDYVLTHHFEEFQDEIIKEYQENNKGIF